MSSLLFALAVLEPSEPREIAWPGPDGAALPEAGGTIAVERCDGTRTVVRTEPTGCARWKIEWSVGGKIWGVSSASGQAAVVKERERLLGYARQSARLFDVPLDARWSSPTAPLCDACDPMKSDEPAGVPAPETPGPDAATQTAWLDARVALSRFETNVLDVHAQRVRDIARLAHEPATARLAKAYAKQLDAAVVDAVHLQLALDNAAVFRSISEITHVQRSIESRAKALEAAAAALTAVVAKAAAKVHAGRYADESITDVNRPQLVVAFNGDKVTATLVVGEAESQWFEGNVALDGAIVGRSLVAPEGTALTCNGHTLECGYVWAPAMLRFADREAPRGKQHLVELWFQQSKWVHAKPFAR